MATITNARARWRSRLVSDSIRAPIIHGWGLRHGCRRRWDVRAEHISRKGEETVHQGGADEEAFKWLEGQLCLL